jgi:hypothetical protein
MATKLALLLLPLALLVAACSSGGKSASAPTDDASPPGSDNAAASSDSADPFASFNPFEVLGVIMGLRAESFVDADPSLTAALLTPGDLPDFVSDSGSNGFTMASEAGSIELASRAFVNGDVDSDAFDTMVSSNVIALPPQVLTEMGDGFALSEDDFDEIQALAGEAGLVLGEVEVLDASGLGDAGFGLSVTMDISGLLGGLGPEEIESTGPGIAFEIYGFIVADKMRMVMVMWPAGQSSGVDARELAEAMAAR